MAKSPEIGIYLNNGSDSLCRARPLAVTITLTPPLHHPSPPPPATSFPLCAVLGTDQAQRVSLRELENRDVLFFSLPRPVRNKLQTPPLTNTETIEQSTCGRGARYWIIGRSYCTNNIISPLNSILTLWIFQICSCWSLEFQQYNNNYKTTE